MCHRCDLFEERKAQITAAMEQVNNTFFPETRPAWADYDPETDPDGLNDPLMEAAAQLTPLEAYLLGIKIHYQLQGDPQVMEKTSRWLMAAMAAPQECPN